MLGVEHALGVQQLPIETRQRQLRRQHGVLDVEQAVVAGREPALLGEPALRAGIRRVDADVHDLRHFEAPFADGGEALLVPVGIGDEVDRHLDAERAGEFERLEIAARAGCACGTCASPRRRSPQARGTCIRGRASSRTGTPPCCAAARRRASRDNISCGCPSSRSPRRWRSRACDWMKATSSTMKTPRSLIEARSSTTRSGDISR